MKIATITIVLTMLITVTGCNTVAGFAADVEAAARGTQDYLADGVEKSRTQPVYHEPVR